MVLEFDVIVDTFSVGIWTATSSLKLVHFKAIVDGETYHYRVINNLKDARTKKEYFSRASIEVHYHAKSAGKRVVFEAVINERRKREKEISDKQKMLF